MNLVDTTLIKGVRGKGMNDLNFDVRRRIEQVKKLYMDSPDNNKVTKYNIEILRDLYDVIKEFQKLSIYAAITTQIAYDMCNEEGLSWTYFNNAKNIRSSINQTISVFRKQREKLRHNSIDGHIYVAFKKDCVMALERVENVRNAFIWPVIDASKYRKYKVWMESQGKDMLKDIDEYYQLDSYGINDLAEETKDVKYLKYITEITETLDMPEVEEEIKKTRALDETGRARRKKQMLDEKQQEREEQDRIKAEQRIIDQQERMNAQDILYQDSAELKNMIINSAINKKGYGLHAASMVKNVLEDVGKAWIIMGRRKSSYYKEDVFVSKVGYSKNRVPIAYTSTHLDAAMIFYDEKEVEKVLSRAERDTAIFSLLEFAREDFEKEQQEEYEFY